MMLATLLGRTAKTRTRMIHCFLVSLLLLIILVEEKKSLHALTSTSTKNENSIISIMATSQQINSTSSTSKPQQPRRNKSRAGGVNVVPIVACVSGIEVKRAASHYLRPGDAILEFGALLNSHVSQHFLQTIGPTGHAVLVNIKHNGINSRGCSNSNSDGKSERRHKRNPKLFLGQNHDSGRESSSSMTDTNVEAADAAAAAAVENGSFKARNQQQEDDYEESFVDQVEYLELDQFDDWRTLLSRNTTVVAAAAEAFEKSSAGAAGGVGAQQQQQQQHCQQQHFDIVFVNVAAMIGNDLHLTALSMAVEFLKQSSSLSLPPRVMILNSRSLSSLARRLCHGQQVVDGTIQMVPPVAPRPTPSDGAMPQQQPSSSTFAEPPYIVATVGVQEYRSTIPFVVQPGDQVVEVGCHSGMTTALLHQQAAEAAGATLAATAPQTLAKQSPQPVDDDATPPPPASSGRGGFCIGVDIGPRIIQTAKKQNPDIPFAVGDAWKTLQLLRLKRTLPVPLPPPPPPPPSQSQSPSTLFGGYDVVYADIGGLSGADGLLESIALLEALGNGLEPRCIVIKSLCMKRLASQLKSFTRIWEKIRDDRPEEQEVEVVEEAEE